jgi:hypothetical protein
MLNSSFTHLAQIALKISMLNSKCLVSQVHTRELDLVDLGQSTLIQEYAPAFLFTKLEILGASNVTRDQYLNHARMSLLLSYVLWSPKMSRLADGGRQNIKLFSEVLLAV